MSRRRLSITSLDTSTKSSSSHLRKSKSLNDLTIPEWEPLREIKINIPEELNFDHLVPIINVGEWDGRIYCLNCEKSVPQFLQCC